jgi:hypothetical protein
MDAHQGDAMADELSLPALHPRPRHPWLTALGSVVTVLLAAPFGWLVLLALTVPADRGEEGAAWIMGTFGAGVWMALVVASAAIASKLPRRPRSLVFWLGLAASVSVTLGPLVLLDTVS